MLQEMNNSIVEVTNTVPSSNCIGSGSYVSGYTQYLNYPVYVYTDKTKKAIEIFKMLQTERMIKCDSVPKFIELVDKISNLL